MRMTPEEKVAFESRKCEELLIANGYGWVVEYDKKLFRNQSEYIFHGTHLSNVTGTRFRGLVPQSENGKSSAFTFFVSNPISAIIHILNDGQYDTYRDEPDYPKMSVNEKLKNDPLIVLRIDLEAIRKDNVLTDENYRWISKGIQNDRDLHQQGNLYFDLQGFAIPTTVDPKYIKALIHDKEGRVHELSLDDLIDNVLLQSKLGIVPDFL